MNSIFKEVIQKQVGQLRVLLIGITDIPQETAEKQGRHNLILDKSV